MKEIVALVCVFGFSSFVLYGTYQATVIHGWSPWWWLLAILICSAKVRIGNDKEERNT